jgi:hypothetical protein
MKNLFKRVKRAFRWVYRRGFWVQDATEELSVWFDDDGKIIPVGYKGPYSNTAHPKNWKETNKILDAMEQYGCKNVTVTVLVSIFGKRRYDIDYEYCFGSVHNMED